MQAGSSSPADSQQQVEPSSTADVLFCGTRLSYLDFVLSCLAISQDVVNKEGSQLSKVCVICISGSILTKQWHKRPDMTMCTASFIDWAPVRYKCVRLIVLTELPSKQFSASFSMKMKGLGQPHMRCLNCVRFCHVPRAYCYAMHPFGRRNPQLHEQQTLACYKMKACVGCYNPP